MTIYSFDSLEDMFAFMQRDQEIAERARKDHPIKVEDLKHGDHFFSVRPDLDVVIFGHVIETTEYEEDNESIQANRSRGYIFAKCYSPLCTEGELGDIHVTNVSGKISEAEFLRAKANGFRHVLRQN